MRPKFRMTLRNRTIYSYVMFKNDMRDLYIWMRHCLFGIPRHKWNTLWIRKDEFHKSLDMDIEITRYMTGEQLRAYFKDLAIRRQIAHT